MAKLPADVLSFKPGSSPVDDSCRAEAFSRALPGDRLGAQTASTRGTAPVFDSTWSAALAAGNDPCLAAVTGVFSASAGWQGGAGLGQLAGDRVQLTRLDGVSTIFAADDACFAEPGVQTLTS